MLKKIITSSLLVGISLSFLSCEKKSSFKFPSYNENYKPQKNEVGFELSQDYPDSHNVEEDYPWLNIDFKTKEGAFKYLDTVLKYCLEGNKEVNFKGQDNSIRKWYHAPWMHDDQDYDSNTGLYIGAGREYLHGLTRERSTPIGEIHDDQKRPLQTWAVALYNEAGAHTFYNVWKLNKDGKPKLDNANFPEGSVSFKLLFTDGTVEDVPFLENSLEWEANIYPEEPTKFDGSKESIETAKKRQTRINRKVRLFQIDIAVKDNRAGKSGWVMGTFIYDASKKGNNVWEKMNPVGLSWGDDSDIETDFRKDGSFVNNDLKQTILNEELIRSGRNYPKAKAYMKYHGIGGRLNGPADNPNSSCISCHGQAAITIKGEPMDILDYKSKRTEFPKESFQKYFSTPYGGVYRRKDEKNTVYINTDYSLQMAMSIRNYINDANIKKSKNSDTKLMGSENQKQLPIIKR